MKKRQLTTKKPPTERIIADIRTLRDNGKSDQEIRALLKIRDLVHSQRHIRPSINKISKYGFPLPKNNLETELLRMKNALEETYRISLAMAKDPEYEDRLNTLQQKDDARLSIIHLLVEYPDFVRKMEQHDRSEEQSNNIESTLKRYILNATE